MSERNEEFMSDLARGERLQNMLTKEELQALDDWRFERRMPSRASAVRELLRRGLSAEGFSVATAGTKSQDFGMIGHTDGMIGHTDGKLADGELVEPTSAPRQRRPRGQER
jgi:hypothetical protein